MSTLDAFKASLANPAPVYVLVGGEGFLVREALDLLRSAVVAGPLAAFNDATYIAAEERGAALFDSATSRRSVRAPKPCAAAIACANSARATPRRRA